MKVKHSKLEDACITLAKKHFSKDIEAQRTLRKKDYEHRFEIGFWAAVNWLKYNNFIDIENDDTPF